MPEEAASIQILKRTGETACHARLKTLALAWAFAQGMSLAAPEVTFPHRRFRVDVAACRPERKVPGRRRPTEISSILKAAAVFECKQARGDLIRDNQRRHLIAKQLDLMEERKRDMETLLRLHLPHLSNGDTLFPECDSYRLREHRHEGYRRLVKGIRTAKGHIIKGTKFDRLLSYRMANVHYLVVEESLIQTHEVPFGWGLLARQGDEIHLISQPQWQNIGVEEQLIFLQRIAARKSHPAEPARGRPSLKGSA